MGPWWYEDKKALLSRFQCEPETRSRPQDDEGDELLTASSVFLTIGASKVFDAFTN